LARTPPFQTRRQPLVLVDQAASFLQGLRECLCSGPLFHLVATSFPWKSKSRQPDIILLPVRFFARIVLELKIRIEFDVFSHREQRTRIKVRRAPFFILTLIEGLGRNVGNEMVRTDRNRPFQCQLVPISPRKATILPIEVRAIPIRDQNACWEREVKSHGLSVPVNVIYLNGWTPTLAGVVLGHCGALICRFFTQILLINDAILSDKERHDPCVPILHWKARMANPPVIFPSAM